MPELFKHRPDGFRYNGIVTVSFKKEELDGVWDSDTDIRVEKDGMFRYKILDEEVESNLTRSFRGTTFHLGSFSPLGAEGFKSWYSEGKLTIEDVRARVIEKYRLYNEYLKFLKWMGANCRDAYEVSNAEALSYMLDETSTGYNKELVEKIARECSEDNKELAQLMGGKTLEEFISSVYGCPVTKMTEKEARDKGLVDGYGIYDKDGAGWSSSVVYFSETEKLFYVLPPNAKTISGMLYDDARKVSAYVSGTYSCPQKMVIKQKYVDILKQIPVKKYASHPKRILPHGYKVLQASLDTSLVLVNNGPSEHDEMDSMQQTFLRDFNRFLMENDNVASFDYIFNAKKTPRQDILGTIKEKGIQQKDFIMTPSDEVVSEAIQKEEAVAVVLKKIRQMESKQASLAEDMRRTPAEALETYLQDFYQDK